MFLFALLFVADKFHFPFSMSYQMHIKLLMPIVDACSIKTIRIIWSVSDSRVIPCMSCQEQNMIEYIIFYWPYHCYVVQDFFCISSKKRIVWYLDNSSYLFIEQIAYNDINSIGHPLSYKYFSYNFQSVLECKASH